MCLSFQPTPLATEKVIKYFGDFSELRIPKSRSWVCDAVLRLACAAR